MCVKFGKQKSELLRNNPKRGIGFEEVQEIVTYLYKEDCRSDDPKQFRAIGWVMGQLCSHIYEVREHEEGEYYHQVTLLRSTKEEQRLYEKTANRPAADEFANMAVHGENLSKYFTNKGTMKQPVQRVNVDFTVEILHELDVVASELNISRQAVIKSYLRQALDQHYLAKNKVN